jgi:hypothetical protein
MWMQGEQNVNQDDITETYPCMFDGLVNTWSSLGQEEGQGEVWKDVYYFYVQLSTWNNQGGSNLANFRQAQIDILKRFRNNRVAMVTAADLGDPDSPYGDIHPRNKQEVGRRLALAISSTIYNRDNSSSSSSSPMNSDIWMGPSVVTVTAKYIHNFHTDRQNRDKVQGTYGVLLYFKSGNGLYYKSPQACPHHPTSPLCGIITITTQKGKIYKVPFDEDHIVITSINNSISNGDENENEDERLLQVTLIPLLSMPEYDHPVYISYGWGDYPMLVLYDKNYIPVLPFVRNISLSF